MAVAELVRAERRYFGALTIRTIDVQRAINNNSLYYEKLFNLYQNTKSQEDRLELAQELSCLNQQMSALHHIKLSQGEKLRWQI